MQIEAGKYYRTRDGRKVGPMEKWSHGEYWHDGGDWLWEDNGENFQYDRIYELDLISEWQDEHPNDPATPDLAALAAQHRIKITV